MKLKRFLFALVPVFLFTFPGYAWLYPEHRDIAIRAIQRMDSSHRKMMDQLWFLARNGHESRLTLSVIDTALGLSPQQIDYASWPAISGDHSCSPQNLTDIVLYSNWILKVADVASRLKDGLAKATNSREIDNEMRTADLKLLRVDPEYVSRAGKNYSHFKLALPDIRTSAAEYMNYCIKTGTPLNLTGIYTWFHSSALEKARYFSLPGLTDQQKAVLALSILADEAFALHFLEDCFASGHLAGIWGDASQRKGTHDFYNANGYQVTTWDGERMVLMGDAYMRDCDEERAAYTAQLSLEQVLDRILSKSDTGLNLAERQIAVPDTFNICSNMVMPERHYPENPLRQSQKILLTTPVPGLDSGQGAMPRSSTELGPFVGFTTAVRGSVLNHGFSTYQNTFGFVPGLEVAVRFGLGMEGLLNETSDGLVFLDIGWRLDGASSMKIYNDSLLSQLGTFASAIPNRDALFFRLRLPFYLIPGDLILLAPTLLFIDKNAMNKVIATAGNGGLIPWQRRMITSIGSFQFVLGREVGISLYGYGNEPDDYFLPVNDLYEGVFCGMHSTQLNFPIVEYRMVRSYGLRQSADLFLQLYAGIDIPGKRKNLYPQDAPFPPVQNIYFAGLRFVFDYRHYFGGRK
jgi:hypothetical protein